MAPKKKNLFSTCNTESEIMKRLFELSSTDKYSRPELLSMSNIRRSELEDKSINKIVLQKVIIPKDKEIVMNDRVRGMITFSSNPKESSEFEFLGEGMVRL